MKFELIGRMTSAVAPDLTILCGAFERKKQARVTYKSNVVRVLAERILFVRHLNLMALSSGFPLPTLDRLGASIPAALDAKAVATDWLNTFAATASAADSSSPSLSGATSLHSPGTSSHSLRLHRQG